MGKRCHLVRDKKVLIHDITTVHEIPLTFQKVTN